MAAMRHGATSDRVVLPRAQRILDAVLEDPAMPDHLRSPAFGPAVRAWARAEAVADLVFEWAAGRIGEGGMDAVMMPPMPGTKPPLETWRAMDAHAMRLRARLGVDPLSYAVIRRDLGIADRAAEDNLRSLAAQGAEIIARRRAELKARGGDVAGEPA